MVKRQRTILGVVMRKLDTMLASNSDDDCPIGGGGAPAASTVATLKMWLEHAGRIHAQKRNDKNKRYALHAPEVECISKGKARKLHEFGVKVSVAVRACQYFCV